MVNKIYTYHFNTTKYLLI